MSQDALLYYAAQACRIGIGAILLFWLVATIIDPTIWSQCMP